MEPLDARNAYIRQRRKHPRIPVEGLPCRFWLAFVGEYPVDLPPGSGTLLNVSRGGICLESSLKIPMELKVVGRFEFSLQGKCYAPIGRFLWRREAGDVYRYGIEFWGGPFDAFWELQEGLDNLRLDQRG